MKRLNCFALLAGGLAVAGSVALAQMPGRSSFHTFNSQVQVMTSDLVAVGTVENAGVLQELDVPLPYDGKPTKQKVQKFSLRLGNVLRDTAAGVSPARKAVVEVIQVMPPAVTNVAGCPNQKGYTGLFLMKRLAGRTEMLAPRSKSTNEEANVSAIVAGIDGLPWGQVSNGLQMVVLGLGVPQASTNEGYLRIGVAVRNVSKGPITVDRSQAEKRLSLVVGDKETTMKAAFLPVPAIPDMPALQTVTLQPNQIAMLSPRGNPDMGFIVTLPPGEAWFARAKYDPTGEKKGGPPIWYGSLETGVLEVKAFSQQARRPPIAIHQLPAFTVPDRKSALEQNVAPQGSPRRAEPVVPSTSQTIPAKKQ